MNRPGKIVSFKELENLLLNFERILKEHNLSIKCFSDFENAVLESIRLLDHHEWRKRFEPNEDVRFIFRKLIGLQDIIAKLTRINEHPDFRKLKKHLTLLIENIGYQNMKSPVTDQASNKLFELYVASACYDLATNIEIDDPNCSDGTNPDILCTISNHRWGIACKAVHTENEQTLFDRFVEGVEQIERSEAEYGFVIISLKNIIDHDVLWPILNKDDYEKGEEPIFSVYKSINDVISRVDNYGDRYYSFLRDNYDRKFWENALCGKKCIPAINLFLYTTASIQYNSDKPVAPIKRLFVIPPFMFPQYQMRILQDVNDSIQNIGWISQAFA